MRFFKAKKKTEAEENRAVEQVDAVKELKSDLDTAVVPELSAEQKAEMADAPKQADKPAETPAVRLFPGFENEPFEVGYAGFKSAEYGIEKETPMLLLRWKTGDSKWFPLPPVFNKSILEQIHEEDNDLDRLLIGYGYDAEQLVHKG